MTFEQFNRFVEALNIYYFREEELSKALEPFNDSYTIIQFCPTITNSIFKYIEEVFDDKDEWFSYWYFELEQGTKWTNESCFDELGEVIDISSIEKIYQHLCKD